MGLWNWLNGKKTVISGGVLLLSAVLSQVIVGIWEYNPDWMPKLIATLDWVAGPAFLLGLGHKGVKYVAEDPPNKLNIKKVDIN